MTPVRFPIPTEICFSIAIASSSLIYASALGPSTGQEGVVYNSDFSVVLLQAGAQTDLIIDSKAKKWSKFQKLVKEWHAERGAISSITQMSMLPSYQKIIGMGEESIPMILAQLRSEGDEPDQWFWALRCLSDANPVKPEDQGDFLAMSRAWIAWGEQEEYAG